MNVFYAFIVYISLNYYAMLCNEQIF